MSVASDNRTRNPDNAARGGRLFRAHAHAYSEGATDCNNLTHHVLEYFTPPPPSPPLPRWSRCVKKTPRAIYDMMMPGAVANCPCQQRACEAQWGRNFHGMYATVAIAPGSYTKGLGETSKTPKRVCSLNYTLRSADFKVLAERFPEWHFVSRFSNGHDHPIAHTSTKLASMRLLDSLPRGTRENPKVYLDVHGNPGSNERYMAQNPGILILTMVELITPKDYVRREGKWGPRFANGEMRWFECSLRDMAMDPVWTTIPLDGVISIHTTYYYDQGEIARFLERFRCPWYAAMHRFKDPVGSMNGGEQTYVVRQVGSIEMVYQTTTSTGAVYSHPNNRFWFESDSFTYNADGVAWDTQLLCDETYGIRAVYCPAVQCRMSEQCADYQDTLLFSDPNTQLTRQQGGDSFSGSTAQTQADIARTGHVQINTCGVVYRTPIRPQLVPFFGEMRTAISGKARTSAQYTDHIARCKIRHTSVMRDSGVTIDAVELADIYRLSFIIDFADQYAADRVVLGAHYATTIAADALYREGAGYVTKGTIAALSGMLMAAVDAKTPTQAIVRGTRAGLAHLNRLHIA